jgi:hypothetical protein
MNALNRLIVQASRRWWVVLIALALNMAAFAILFSLEDQFEALTGVPTFDTQNDLTQAAIVAQLPLYQGEARAAYLRFIAFDFVFPLVAAGFLVLFFTVLLRLNTGSLAQRLLRAGVAFIPLGGTLADYLENASFLAILNFGAAPVFLDAAILFKQIKLLFLYANGPLLLLLVGMLAAHVIHRWRTRNRVTMAPEGAAP